MSKLRASCVQKAVERLSRCDLTLKYIVMNDTRLTVSEMAELTDCLLVHPDVVTHVYLSYNRLTDETGAKLARYLAVSSTIEYLGLYNNRFGSATYLALAALRVNSSLQVLYLFGNREVNQIRIDAAFAEALRFNPIRPAISYWALYSHDKNNFERLYDNARSLGPPSMLEQLRHCDCTRTKTKIREICFFLTTKKCLNTRPPARRKL